MARRDGFHAPKGFYRIKEHGWCYPEYPALPGLAKFRAKARKGLKAMSKAERHAYGDAVEKAIRALQLRALRPPLAPYARCGCASGCGHPDGDRIEKHLRAAALASLHGALAADHRGRDQRVVEAAYEAAMKEKRAREKAADRLAIPADGGIPEFLRRAA